MGDSDFVSEQFGDVDKAPDPSRIVRYLDAATGSQTIQRLKRSSYELLEPKPGQRLLDVGCGTGDDVRALTAYVGTAGRVVGLDYSRTVLGEALKRSTRDHLPVGFCRGDSCRLPFPDGAFDGVRSERMLQHLREPFQAIREMVRVVKPGGRVVDFDPDWNLVAIDSDNLPLTRKIVTFRADRITSGAVGRKLFAFFRDAGLLDVVVVPMATVLPSFAMAGPMLELEASVERAQEAGVITSREASAWLEEMKERDATGRFFCGLASYMVTGRKPRDGSPA